MVQKVLPFEHGTHRGDIDMKDGSKQAPEDAPEPRQPSDLIKQLPNANSPITNLYLTFQTVIPTANTTRSGLSSPKAPPPTPNLTPYADPKTWPAARKNLLLALSCIATFLTAYTAGAYSPSTRMMATLFNTSQTAVMAGITTFCLGFALAPMVLAPFSEINGRYPVFVVSGFLYVLFQAVCAVVTNLPGMLMARLLVGVGGSVFSTMVGGVIADMWEAEGRNTPMALFSGSVLAGTGAGPLIAAVITERLGGHEGSSWRWIFWHQVIAGSVLMVALVVFFKESRGSVLLSRKAKALNQWHADLEAAGYFGVWIEVVDTKSERSNSEATLQPWAAVVSVDTDEEKTLASRVNSHGSNTGYRLERIRWLVLEDEERSSIGKMISISLYRPFHLLFTEPVVFFFSLWVAFAWAVLYLTFSSIFSVFGRVYHWNIEQSGRVFVAMIVGSGVATIIGVFQERIRQADDQMSATLSKHRFLRHFPTHGPEARLRFTCFTATLLPIGLFIFGFTARPDVHWIVPTIAIGFATMGIYSVYLATFNYLADVYHKYASSALAAQSFCRNVLGGVFPIVSAAMFARLGEPGSGVLLGTIGTLLTLVPWVLMFFGEKIRRRSKFAMQLESSS